MAFGQRNQNSRKTHCIRGHVFDEANTYWQRSRTGAFEPKRGCRKCQAERMARHRRDIGLDVVAAQMRAWRAKDPERDRRNWRENRKRKKAWLDSQKISCSRCGETHPACLEFHHRDRKQKEFQLAIAVARYTLKRIQAEVAKCDVICSNCHRKLHYGTLGRKRKDP